MRYYGNESASVIRERVLEKILEINKISAKYKWINRLSVNVYLVEPVINRDVSIYQIESTPKERERMVNENIHFNDLAGYVCRFGVDVDSEYFTDHDKEIFCSK